MRIDGRTNGAGVMRSWSEAMGIPFLGVLRETAVQARALERGLTIFDLRPSQVATDLAQWQGHPRLAQAGRLAAAGRQRRPRAARAGRDPHRLGSAGNLMPAQESLVHGTRLSGVSASRVEHRAVAGTLAGSRPHVPQFLKR